MAAILSPVGNPGTSIGPKATVFPTTAIIESLAIPAPWAEAEVAMVTELKRIPSTRVRHLDMSVLPVWQVDRSINVAK
jgi:hypothetical protein